MPTSINANVVALQLYTKALGGLFKPDDSAEIRNPLAAIIGHGFGAFRVPHSNDAIGLLSPLLSIKSSRDEAYTPALVCGRISPDTIPLSQVVQTLRRRYPHITIPDNATDAWAPAATRTLVSCVLGGDLPEPIAQTSDWRDSHNSFNWFDLATLGPGQCVFWVNRYWQGYFYQQLGDDRCARVKFTCSPRNVPLHNMAFNLLNRLRLNDPQLTISPATHAPPPLLHLKL